MKSGDAVHIWFGDYAGQTGTLVAFGRPAVGAPLATVDLPGEGRVMVHRAYVEPATFAPAGPYQGTMSPV